MNHVVELGASWLLLAPFRALSTLGGAIQICFQLAILISGNLSFLNYLTILPFVWCFDDRRGLNHIPVIVDVLCFSCNRAGLQAILLFIGDRFFWTRQGLFWF